MLFWAFTHNAITLYFICFDQLQSGSYRSQPCGRHAYSTQVALLKTQMLLL